MHAAESVAYLNRAQVRLQDIWEEIGIPEEQRLQRTNEVHKHIKVSPKSIKNNVDSLAGPENSLITLVLVLQGLLDLMIAEEEELKNRLLKSIESCQEELKILCSELQLPPFEVQSLEGVYLLIFIFSYARLFADMFGRVEEEEEGCTMLQMEKNSRTRLEVMKEHKKQRMEELKGLIAKDRELCGIMCTKPFGIEHDSVPSLQQLKNYHAYLDDLNKEKVPVTFNFS